MEACDCCGKRVDERSMEFVGKRFFVCQACHGMYDDQELLEKCIEASLESQTPTGASPKPGSGKACACPS